MVNGFVIHHHLKDKNYQPRSGKMHDRRMKQAILIWLFMVFLIFVFTACDYKENAVIREQTETFTGEIKEKNKDMQLLANKLEIAEEKIRQLNHQLF